MAATEFKKIEILFSRLQRERIHKFPKRGERLDAPNEQGVYIICSPAGNVLHVGSTPRARKGIAQRLRNHLATQSSFAIKYLNADGSRLRNGYKFRYLIVRSARQRALLEALAIGHLCPAHIGVGRSALVERTK